jgi:hypothetical protein
MLNSFPANMTSLIYQWSEAYDYDYSGYPQRTSGGPWSMVSEPVLDNKLYASYNVTKNLANTHLAGLSDVKLSSSDNSDIKIVSSKYNNLYAITVINSGTDSVNETLNTALVPANSLPSLSICL